MPALATPVGNARPPYPQIRPPNTLCSAIIRPPADHEQPALRRQWDRSFGPGRHAKVLAQFIEGRAELGSGGEASEPPHRVGALLDGSVILLNPVVQVLIAAMPHRPPNDPPDRFPIRGMRIGRDAEGLSFRDLEETPQKAARGVLVAVRAQHRIDQRALAVDRSIEVASAPGDLHVGLIDVPGDARAAARLARSRSGRSGAKRNSQSRIVSCITGEPRWSSNSVTSRKLSL